MIKYIAGRPGRRQKRNTAIWSNTGFQVSHICCYESTCISARALESSQYKLYTIYYPKKSNQLVVCTSNPPYIALLTADSYNLVTVAIRREIDIKPTGLAILAPSRSTLKLNVQIALPLATRLPLPVPPPFLLLLALQHLHLEILPHLDSPLPSVCA